MKKHALVILSIVVLSVVMSCSTFGGLEGVYIPKLTVETKTYETIDGVTTINQLKIRNKVDLWTWTLLFEEIKTPKITFNTIKIKFFGNGWKFYDTIDIKTDTQISKLLDENPSRVIRSGGSIIETVSVVLSDELIKEIQETSSLTIGLSTVLFPITPEELTVIKGFLPK